MPHFVDGFFKFKKDVYPQNETLFETLSHGQSPEALFITCADSRIETAMITQTKPGDLFVCRNAGNIVPLHDDNTDGMSASIEYAVAVLNVPHIVVCGHSGCGAMAGAMAPDKLEALPLVKDFLCQCQPAVDHVKANGAGKSDDEKMAMLIEQNVLLQIENLKTHPSVAKRIEAGNIHLHGWVYDIKSGDIMAYDPKKAIFIALEEIDFDPLTP